MFRSLHLVTASGPGTSCWPFQQTRLSRVAAEQAPSAQKGSAARLVLKLTLTHLYARGWPATVWIEVCTGNSHPTIAGTLEHFCPDGIVCANDITAARLMQTLEGFGVGVPSDMRIVGIDDVKYAALLGVPLTTLHQPCREIGETAIRTMLERIANPQLPARDVLLDCKLVIRRSCGSHLSRPEDN